MISHSQIYRARAALMSAQSVPLDRYVYGCACVQPILLVDISDRYALHSQPSPHAQVTHEYDDNQNGNPWVDDPTKHIADSVRRVFKHVHRAVVHGRRATRATDRRAVFQHDHHALQTKPRA